jgi:DNA excision repair protein ERCC-3
MSDSETESTDFDSDESLKRDDLQLKHDHHLRPIWVGSNLRIILESFSPISTQAQDLLIAISEPVTRPRYMHEYKLSENSLYAAVSVGLQADDIIDALDRLCKTSIAINVLDFIRNSTKKFGQAKVILQNGRFCLESQSESVAKELLADPLISTCKNAENSLEFRVEVAPAAKSIEFVVPILQNKNFNCELDIFDEFQDVDPDQYINSSDGGPSLDAPVLPANPTTNLDDDEEIEPQEVVHRFEIQKEKVETVKKRCDELGYPVLEEYEFRADQTNANLDIDLKPKTKLRPYQEKSLSKLFGNGRARSGIIVLPCGAGKTLVGVTAACTIKKSCIVLCNSTLSVEQWAREFRYWSTIKDKSLARFSSDRKEKFETEAGVLITTYTMLGFSGKRASDAEEIMNFIKGHEWGFMLLDEVHVVPADMFKKTLSIAASHSKLGLTATNIREDAKISTLNWLIGPKLYEANWQELARAGYIASVQCNEVWCSMTRPFFREYLREKTRKRQLLYLMNPRKIQVCQYLINLHESMVLQ